MKSLMCVRRRMCVVVVSVDRSWYQKVAVGPVYSAFEAVSLYVDAAISNFIRH